MVYIEKNVDTETHTDNPLWHQRF